MPTSAFKMRVQKERANLPAIAIALKGTPSWQHLSAQDGRVSFETRFTKLYLVVTKQIGGFAGHFGVGLTDVRVRNLIGWEFVDANVGELQQNLRAPFGGFSVQANPKASYMFEVEGLPSFRFSAGARRAAQDIKNLAECAGRAIQLHQLADRRYRRALPQ